MVSFEFLPWWLLLPWQWIILGQKLTTTQPSWNIIARCLHLRHYFRARAMQWCHINFSPENLCCHGNQPFLFKDKIGCRLTWASNAETQLLGYIAWQRERYLVPHNIFLVIKKFYFINIPLSVHFPLQKHVAQTCGYITLTGSQAFDQMFVFHGKTHYLHMQKYDVSMTSPVAKNI